MAIAFVKSNTGTSMLATTTASFSTAPTSGNLIVLGFASDDYNGSPNAGWTQSTGMEQQTFHGGYLWWRISDGSNSLQYTIGSANRSRWVLMEFSGVHATPYDISNGTFTQASGLTQATPSIVPTTGGRLLVAGWGWSLSSGMAGMAGSVSNSFSTPVISAGSEVDAFWMAYRLVTGNGSTGYTTTATITSATTPQSRSGLIISFKEGAAAIPGVKVWSGSAWVEKPAKVWSGSAWTAKPVKTWNGSAWT
jgi:hypothetical protein